MYEYMTDTFHYKELRTDKGAEYDAPSLEAYLDGKASMGWRLHTVKFIDNDLESLGDLTGIVVFERKIDDPPAITGSSYFEKRGQDGQDG